MTAQRQIEIFSAGCPACQDVIALVQSIACESCEVTVHPMTDIEVAKRARAAGIRRVPAVMIDGQLAACCAGPGVIEDTLRQGGLGVRR